MDQAGFFLSGDDFQRRTQSFRRALQEFLLIARVSYRASGHRSHANHIQLLVDLGNSLEIGADACHGVGGDSAVTKNACAQTRYLPFRGQDFGGHTRAGLGGLHAYGVAANVYGGIARHSSIVSWPVSLAANAGLVRLWMSSRAPKMFSATLKLSGQRRRNAPDGTACAERPAKTRRRCCRPGGQGIRARSGWPRGRPWRRYQGARRWKGSC